VFAFEAGAGVLRVGASAGVSMIVAKRAIEEKMSWMRGIRGCDSRRAKAGRRERESNHGGPWIVRLGGECCIVREQHVGGGFGLLWSIRELRNLAGGDLFLRDRSSSTEREEKERRGKQGAGPHEHAGPSRPNVSLSLSPLVHNVDIEPGPTERGPDHTVQRVLAMTSA
jgi:hypothetical protein